MRLFFVATLLSVISVLAACQSQAPLYDGKCPPRAEDAGFCDWSGTGGYASRGW